MINEQELRTLLHERGWYLWMGRRCRVRYAHAKRRVGDTVVTRYLSAETKFSELSSDKVLAKISS